MANEVYDEKGNQIDAQGKIIKTAEQIKAEKEAGPNPNPPQNQEGAPPGATPNPGDRPDEQNQKDKELAELKAKLERLTQQVTGSNEEALRLKGELEKSQARIAELESREAPTPVSDEEFNRRVAEVGMAQAIREISRQEVKPTQEKADSLIEEQDKKIFEDFQANHPGLKGEILDRFNKEYGRLKSSYPTVDEALNAAYAVVGGPAADAEARELARKAEEDQQLEEQSQGEHQRLASHASGGADDRQPSGRAVTPQKNAELVKQINTLTGQAQEKEQRGQNAERDWIRIEELKSQLATRS
jgi:hypothetical protein